MSNVRPTRPDGPTAPALEIERKFLLRDIPPIPSGAAVWRIEQGYLSISENDKDGIVEGRLRRTTMPGGSVVCTHTRKSGFGLTRHEQERVISIAQFERHWPRTAGRRLRKTRHRVPVGGLIWEIDVFQQIELVLAEVELDTPDQPCDLPDWLGPHVVREVTDDPAYTNSTIAMRIAKQSTA